MSSARGRVDIDIRNSTQRPGRKLLADRHSVFLSCSGSNSIELLLYSTGPSIDSTNRNQRKIRIDLALLPHHFRPD
jgi:hypothetical protein